MKKVLITGIATAGLALGALGQGSITLDNSLSTGGPTTDSAGNYYNGTIGVEVWQMNGSSASANINSLNGTPGGAAAAYGLLSSDGFTLVSTLSGKSTTTAGVIGLGEVDMPGVTPAGGNTVVALVMWNSSAASFGAALNAGPPTKAGILTFVNPTSNYTTPPPNTPTPQSLSGWNTDLIMTAIPEPSSFALCGLGAAAMMIFRRRK